MTRLRRAAIILMAASLIVAAVYATGAFTTLTAKRGANIAVAGDSASFLSIQPASGPNGEYARLRGGTLSISLGGALKNSKATGLNKQAVTVVRNIFTITNHGSQPLGIWITDKSNAITFKGGTNWKTVEGRKNAIKLRPGKTLYVGLSIDTRGRTGSELINKMTIHANAEISGATVKTGPSEPVVDKSSGTTTSSPDSSSSGDSSSSKNKDGGDSKSGSDKGDKSVKTHKDDSSMLEDAWKGFKTLTLGFTLGNWGMPGGVFTAKESSSPLYLLGQLLNAVAPWGLDMVADLRDILANVASGKTFTWGTALNVVGLLPVLGSLDSVSDLRKITQNWMSAFPSKADEVVGFLSNAIIKHLPGGLGAKLLGVISDAPVSKLTNKGIPVDDIIQYSDERVDFQRVLELRSKGVSPEEIRYFVDNDIKLSRVSRLRDQGVSANRIKFFLGDGAPKMIGKLQSQGLSLAEVSHLIDEGADLKMVSKLRSQGVSTGYIRYYVDEGVDLGEVSKLESRGISRADINYFVKNDIKPSGVNKLLDRGASPGQAEWLLKKVKRINEFDKFEVTEESIGNLDISNRVIKRINKAFKGTHRFSEKAILIAASSINYNGWKDARKKNKKATQDFSIQKQSRPTKRSVRGRLGEIHL